MADGVAWTSDDVAKWTVEQVVSWAKGIVSDKHALKLQEQEIDGASLIGMAKQTQAELRTQLERYGILGGPATKLASAIKVLCGPTGSTGPYTGISDSEAYISMALYDGTGFYNLSYSSPQGWNVIEHSLCQQILTYLDKTPVGVKIAISGRRRLGKSLALSQVGTIWKQQKKSFFLIEAQDSWPGMYLWLGSILPRFDPALSNFIPLNQRAFVGFLSWLLRSGVMVAIDEFQLLAKVDSFQHYLRSEIDQRGATWTGPLVVFGSHVSEIEQIIDSQTSPLFGRNWERFYVKPWSFCEIYRLILPFHLDPLILLGLYTCFDGVVGFYEPSFKSNFDLGYSITAVKRFSYSDQLSANHSATLTAIAEKSGSPVTKIYDYIPQRTSLKRYAIQQVISDLKRYEFCTEKKPWLEGQEIILLTDNPLRVQRLSGNETSSEFLSLQGTVFEEVCRSIIRDTKCLGKATEVIDYYWSEHCTEIDVVAVDKQSSTVFWGSCKRNGQNHSLWNQLCHVISFFNNRGQNHEWYNWKHVFVFLSPTFTTEKRQKLTACTELNEWLERSQKDDVIRMCVSNLSNWAEAERRSFTPKNLPDTPLSLRISECRVMDLSELVTKSK